MHGLMSPCNKIKATLKTTIAQGKSKTLSEGLQKRLGPYESNDKLAKATFLHKQFKKNGFDNEANYISLHRNVTATLTRMLSNAAAISGPASASIQQPAAAETCNYTAKFFLN